MYKSNTTASESGDVIDCKPMVTSYLWLLSAGEHASPSRLLAPGTEFWLGRGLVITASESRHTQTQANATITVSKLLFYMINNFTNINSCPPEVYLYLWGRSSPRTPCPVASCLPGPPTHSSGSATATFWLMDCWGRGLPEEMGGQSGA